MSSIFQNAHEIITEISMSRERSPWIVVEGESDEKLFRARSFFRKIKLAVAHGWEGVSNVLEAISKIQSYAPVIGVIDRDYRDHTRTQPEIQSLIVTDLRDIEVILFFSSALQRVFSEKGAAAKLPKNDIDEINFSEILDKITFEAEKIGKYRAYCHVNQLPVTFSSIDHIKFIDDKSLAINHKSFLAHLRGKNSGVIGITEDDWELSQSCNGLDSRYCGREFICHGHDLMAIAAISLRKKWGSCGGSVSREDIESLFRIGYPDSELEATMLWQSLTRLITA